MSTSTAYSTEITQLYPECSQMARAYHPLLHDAACCLRSCAPLCLLFGLALVLLAPVANVAFADTSLFNHAYVHAQLKFTFVPTWLVPAFVFACMFLGMVLAFVLYRFMLVKQQVAAYFSFGMPRIQLYASRLAVGFACIIVTVAVPLFASLCVNIAALGVSEGIFSQFVYCLCGSVVAALVAFLAMALSCSLAGTMLEAALLGCAAMAAVTVFSWGLNALMASLLVGCPYGVSMYGQADYIADSLVIMSAPFNPVLFFVTPLEQHSSFTPVFPIMEPQPCNWLLLAGWLLVCVVLAGLGAFSVRMRKGENAGIAGNSPIVSFVVAAVAGFALFAAVFSALAEIDVRVALAVGIALFVSCACVLLFGPLRSKVRKGRTAAIVVVECMFICVLITVVQGGLFGFSQFVPDADDVASVEVSVVGDPSRMPMSTNSASKGTEYYTVGRFDYDDREEIDLVRSVHESCIASSRLQRETATGDFSQTIVPYDVVVSYEMQDGSKVVRYYDQARISALSCLLGLDSDARMVDMRKALVTGNVAGLDQDDSSTVTSSAAYRPFQSGDIYLADVTYTNPQLLSVDDANRAELLESLASDMASQSLGDHYHPADDALGVIMFSTSGESVARSFAYTLSNVVVYVTPEFKKTIAFLERNDLMACFEPILPIDSIAFMKYDPYVGWNDVHRPSSLFFTGYRVDGDNDCYWVQKDYGTKFEITDSDQVKEVSRLLRSTWFMDDGGYLACAHIAYSDTYVYRYLPAAVAPDYVVKGAR